MSAPSDGRTRAGRRRAQAPGDGQRARGGVSLPAATSSVRLRVLPTASAPGGTAQHTGRVQPGLHRPSAGPAGAPGAGEEERGGPVEGVVEDRLERVTEARVRDQLGVARGARRGSRSRSIRANGSASPERNRTGQRIDGKWAVRSSALLGRARRMEREAEQDERGVVRVGLGGGEARDPAAVRLAADARSPGRRRRGAVGPSGTIARNAGTASSAFLSGRSIARASMPRAIRPADVAGHAGRGAARPVPDVESDRHRAQGRPRSSGDCDATRTALNAADPIGWHRWPGRAMAGARSHRSWWPGPQRNRCRPAPDSPTVARPVAVAAASRRAASSPASPVAVVLAAIASIALSALGPALRSATAARPSRPTVRPPAGPSRSTAAATATASGCRSTARAVGRSPASSRRQILAHYYPKTTLGTREPDDDRPRAPPDRVRRDRRPSR